MDVRYHVEKENFKYDWNSMFLGGSLHPPSLFFNYYVILWITYVQFKVKVRVKVKPNCVFLLPQVIFVKFRSKWKTIIDLWPMTRDLWPMTLWPRKLTLNGDLWPKTYDPGNDLFHFFSLLHFVASLRISSQSIFNWPGPWPWPWPLTMGVPLNSRIPKFETKVAPSFLFFHQF